MRDKLGVFRTENQQWWAMVTHTRNWKLKGLALDAITEPGDTYVAAAIGNLGFYAPDLFIFDRNGLVTREVAELPWNGELRSPGHDKTVDYEFFLDQEPDVLDAKLVSSPNIDERIKAAVKEMKAKKVKSVYYPEILPTQEHARPEDEARVGAPAPCRERSGGRSQLETLRRDPRPARS